MALSVELMEVEVALLSIKRVDYFDWERDQTEGKGCRANWHETSRFHGKHWQSGNSVAMGWKLSDGSRPPSLRSVTGKQIGERLALASDTVRQARFRPPR